MSTTLQLAERIDIDPFTIAESPVVTDPLLIA